MYCPSCGFEYTQKTNYCKRCGESLGTSLEVEAPRLPRPKIAPMFWAITTFGLVGLLMSFIAYYNLAREGLRGDQLMVPFVMGLFFTGTIAGLLIWQLARMITTLQRTNQQVVVGKHYVREAPPAQLGVPAEPMSQPVGQPSVVEHTTRQMAGRYREPQARE